MKRQLFLLTAAVFTAALLSSCQKEDIQVDTPSESSTISLDITASFEDLVNPDTKAYAVSTACLKWTGEETVNAYEVGTTSPNLLTTGSEITVEVVSGTDNREVKLSGTITAPQSGNKVILVVSSLTPTVSSTLNNITFDLSSQSMSDSGQSDFVAYAEVDQSSLSSSTLSNYRATFKIATAIVKFNMAGLPESTALSDATLSGVNTVCNLSITAEGASASGETSGTITRSAGLPDTFSTGCASVYMAVPVQSAASGRTFSVTVSEGTYQTSNAVNCKIDAAAYINTVRNMEKKEYELLGGEGKETANCYIVSAAGNYKFQTLKGNSSEESVDEVSSVEVLWESFGTGTSPDAGDFIPSSGLSYNDGYVYFTTNETYQQGNAVIAAKDKSDNILWSWHIWFIDNLTLVTYNNEAGTMMDRNLGATNATAGDPGALGLLYQWGRKDPFLNSSNISSNTQAASTLSWPSAVQSNADNGTIGYAIAHPTTFITANSTNNDWYHASSGTDNTRWTALKTIYDPCPAGYHVPSGGSSGVWAIAFGTSTSWTTTGNWDSTNRGMNFSTTDKTLAAEKVWYPAAGCRDGSSGSLGSVGSGGCYWSCTPYDDIAYFLYFDYDGCVVPASYSDRAYGGSVRCVQN